MRKTVFYLKPHIFIFFQKLYQCEIKLQTKIQIPRQHNKSKLKNTYRIKETTVKDRV